MMLTKHLLVLTALALFPALFCNFFCYDIGCKNYDGTYIECHQNFFDCQEGDYWDNSATCTYTGSGDTWHRVYCSDNDTCSYQSYSGEASCQSPDDDDTESDTDGTDSDDSDDSDNSASFKFQVSKLIVSILTILYTYNIILFAADVILM